MIEHSSLSPASPAPFPLMRSRLIPFHVMRELQLMMTVLIGMQQSLLAAQAVLSIEDIPIGTSIIIFFQSLGGALFVSISQNLFTNRLVENITALNLPGVSAGAVLGAGATNLAHLAPKYTPQILVAYNDALLQPFIATTAMACFSIIGALGMQWVSVKGKKVEMAVA